MSEKKLQLCANCENFYVIPCPIVGKQMGFRCSLKDIRITSNVQDCDDYELKEEEEK